MFDETRERERESAHNWNWLRFVLCKSFMIVLCLIDYDMQMGICAGGGGGKLQFNWARIKNPHSRIERAKESR